MTKHTNAERLILTYSEGTKDTALRLALESVPIPSCLFYQGVGGSHVAHLIPVSTTGICNGGGGELVSTLTRQSIVSHGRQVGKTHMQNEFVRLITENEQRKQKVIRPGGLEEAERVNEEKETVRLVIGLLRNGKVTGTALSDLRAALEAAEHAAAPTARQRMDGALGRALKFSQKSAFPHS